MTKMRTFLAAAVAALSLLPAWPGRAQLMTAGTLHVDLRSTNASAATATWANEGALGGGFTRFGAPTVVSSVAGTGVPGVSFNGTGDYFVGPAAVADITGANDYSIETWTYNPALATEETILAWGIRGATRVNNGLNFGSHLTWGAATFYNDDLGWGTADLIPAENQWHHLVLTYDGGTTVRMYVDGTLRVSKTLAGVMATSTAYPIEVGCQRNADNATFSMFYGGYVNMVRVHGGQLSAAAVSNNFALGPMLILASGPVTITNQPASVTVTEGTPASFVVGATGTAPITCRWFRDGLLVQESTNQAYALATAALADDGASFWAVASNVFTNVPFTATSVVAVLHVAMDTNPPALVRAQSISTNAVLVAFSEPLQAASATNVANYFLTNFAGAVPITGASLDASGRMVTLSTAALAEGSFYTVVVSNILDRAAIPNPIAPGSLALFLVTPLVVNDLGSPASVGWLGLVGTNLAFTAGGTNIGGTADQCSFAWEARTGDFDVQLKLRGLSLADVWSEAGLMARVTLDANSAFVGSLATPSVAGAFQEYRSSAGGATAMAGSFPVNYPNTWLRLRRAGGTFTSFASYDGQSWTQLGSVSLTLTNTLLVGVAVSSHNAAQTTTAQLSDYGTTVSTNVGAVANPSEPLGPSTRWTGLVISEIMYKPAKRGDGKNVEFIEIFNSNPFFHDISRHRLAGDIDFTFPSNTIVAGGSFIVVASSPADVQSVYGLSGVFGPYTNSLKTAGMVKMFDEAGALMLEIPYSSDYPWPVGASGTGHSVVLARPSYGESDSRAWDISDVTGGSPGAFESFRPSPLRNVVINELLAHSGDTNQPDFIELYNHSNQSNDISGCLLSDAPDTNKFVIPSGTVIPPRGFVAFTAAQLGFGLSSTGEKVYFKNPDASRVLDAVQYGPQASDVSFGRQPDGANDFYPLAVRTPGASNSAPLVHDIVINELMYNPISKNDDDQFVELYNRGTNTMNLGRWKFTGGISFTFTFPPDVPIAPDGYLVVARNRTNLLAKYANLNATNTVGNFGGTLAHGGERIALGRPEDVVTTNTHGVLVTNTLYITVDEVTYRSGGRWGNWAAGGGSSLELIDPRANHRLAANWADSDETAKAPWTIIQVTNTLDNGANYAGGATTFMQIGIMDPGEALVDDIEVLPVAGTPNYVANPTFNADLANWSLLGCFSRSSLEVGAGYGGTGNALHLRTANRFFSLANSAQGSLNNTSLTNGNTATLRFKARWLKGCPEIVMRLQGNWLEASGSMQVPGNLGTPGARNSRAITNAGPAIFAVVHAPALPAAGQAAAVTARVDDPDSVTNLVLRYRVDPTATYTSVAMVDDGTGADAVAGDGIFTGSIPAQVAGAVVAFIVTAADARGATNSLPALLSNNGPEREAVVRWGDPSPASSFGVYHWWLTGANITRWSTLPVLSNEDMDGTLVYNNRVIYNIALHYGGSPYHQPDRGGIANGPTNGPCHYNMEVPTDDRLLGFTTFNKIQWPGNDIQDDTATVNSNDATLQREQAANMLLRGLGSPWVYRRFVSVYVNGVQRGEIMEDALRPTGSVPDIYFPGDRGGYLYKIQPWFEGGAAMNANMSWPWANMSWAYLNAYTTTGGAYKQARYRWCYEPRTAADYLNNFTNVYALVTAAANYTSSNWPAMMKNVADMENWMRMIAANHAAGNWDCYGFRNGQNIYGYISPAHRWTLYMFDFNICLGNRIAQAAGSNLEETTPDYFANIYGATGHPEFRRMYWRALKELVNGPMTPTAFDPLLDAKYTALRASGIPAAAPTGDKSYVVSARASIITQVATHDCAGCVPSASLFNTTSNVAILGGVAALDVVEIRVNGVGWPITWTSMSNWTMRVPVPSGSNVFTVVGCDRFGNAVSAASNQVSIVSTAPAPDAAIGSVVINEIMFNPSVPNAEYVELFNNSTSTAFDLSGWQFSGLSYAFPPGSMIAPRSFLVLARSRTVFAVTYGVTVPVFDEFGGNLQFDGETLTLLQPGTPDLVISKVRYESTVPWPTAPGGAPTPASMQVIDPRQDNRRPCNWQTFSGVATTNFTWNFASVTANYVSSGVGNRLWIFLTGVGDAYVDDICFVPGAIAGVGSNFVRNGDFESPLIDVPRLTNSWIVSTNYTNSILSTDLKHGGNASLHIICSNAPSPATNKIIYQNLSPGPTNTQLCTLSYWYRTGVGTNTIVVRTQTGTALALTNLVAPTLSAGVYAITPGAANTGAASLPAMPPLWINEVLPFNTNGLADNQGQFEPWIELYNTGTNTVSLAGLYLANNFNDVAQWAFPADATIGPGQFKLLIADGQTNQTTPTELHTNFRLNPTNGTVALAWLQFGQPAVLDYVNYVGVPVNYSYGSVPDGQPFDRQLMYFNSPGGTNDGASAPIIIYINEWMADNSRTLADPADNDYEDWFELFNPNSFPVDLTGWTLANALTNAGWSIPSGYVIPANGYLLVWADKETGQNNSNRIDLHIDFKLSKAGETIVVRAPDGRLVDTVTFGAQTTDVSEGRYPDGSASRHSFTVPTPRAANVLPNHPPVLTPISNQAVHVGETVTFTASATDPESPPQTLVFSVGTNAPARASIEPGSGVFSWVPSLLGVYSISVVVTDNGTPSMSATQNFSVTVQSLQVAGLLALGDFVGPVGNGFGTRPVTFKAADNAGIVLASWNQTLSFAPDARGYGVAAYTLTNVPLGTVRISAKTVWHLRKRLPVTFSGGLAEADFIGAAALLGGDLDGSNMVDMGDYNQLAIAWYTTQDASDLDGSGLVDILDYFILASHWSQQGDPE